MRNFENVKWKDFYLSEFFCCEKGNQNNMASLTAGDIPLISAKNVITVIKISLLLIVRKHSEATSLH